MTVTVAARVVGRLHGEFTMRSSKTTSMNAIAKMENNIRNLRRILLERYGLGDNPELRSYQFERLEQLAIKYGEPVYRTIECVVGIAKYARTPDRFFCTVVMRRLAEQGFIHGENSL